MATDIQQYSKEELGSALDRVKARAIKYKQKAVEVGEELMMGGIEMGAAFGMGWWIGQIKKDGDYTEEDLQFWGIDKELVFGLGFVILGMSGLFGRQLGAAAKAAGRGILSGWAFTQGEAIGSEPDEEGA